MRTGLTSHYRYWAIKHRVRRLKRETQEGLEQVKFLLHTYEHGEAQQAKAPRPGFL